MKFLVQTLLLMVMGTGIATAQNAAALIKDARQLSNQKNYAGAVEKYKSALTIEPGNIAANYQLAFALFASGKGPEGLPYLDKVVNANAGAPLKAASYSLMGSIYGNAKQLAKAIDAYKNGIKTDSTNQRIYYNLGIVQYRSKLYPDAEQSFISAIKRDSADAGSVRMYALTTFHENKRAEALLGFCRFLQLEPNTARSKETFDNLQNILQRGTLEAEEGYQPTSATKAEAFTQNKSITKVLAGFMTRKYASQTALLTAQLKELFAALGSVTVKPYRYAQYYNDLSQTDSFETFVRVISQSGIPENAEWVKGNAEKVAALDSWVKTNKLQ
ncbi:tetratricopeptide repeat protein [Mucilaginibacter terrigena]|uniref:Tetratricopeptide repeat protein n=1 Tax=Mucilaginibacter terrigena TaxID=2492395 RepID=A0A4Q5LL15_9SPHI|nr:tetratricopeptide repeat protein [Mucilaginibacter terrigena]RYU89530.1 tetratricopeptide repeat protein [Mucilaginibacter terrigena]